LSESDNAARLDPYERMPDLVLLDAGRMQMALGLHDAARELFGRAVDADPRNPQSARWLARSWLDGVDADPRRSFDLYLQAFESGWRTPDCLSQAAKAASLANLTEDDRRSILDALAFFERARLRGIKDTGFTLAWEAALRHFADQPEAARAAYDKARKASPLPGLDKFLDSVSEQLGFR
jgi:tetratricopeptide (TPR) repeat protein